MSTITELNPRLLALTEAGVSVWLDQLRRSMVEGGELARMVAVESLRGVTSNPAIFEKAILGSTDYDEDLRALARENLDAVAIYEQIAIRDVQLAADVLADVYQSSHGRDGLVSLEVAPELAHDTEGTLAQARAFWKRVNRPNVMIKIPGTYEGIRAIQEALYEGINVNVTLLFSVAAYEQVAEAYLRALERRLDKGLDLHINSVASFFVSRVDTAVDRELEQLGRTDLAGTAALANARAAYRRFKEIFSGGRWDGLRHAGAVVQRPLWASTGTKNPHYSDTKYVDGLVGAHTVNTMPLPTLLAFADHGRVTGPTAEHDPSSDLAALAEAGISLEQVTHDLLDDGVRQFEEAMTRLLAGIEERRAAVVTGRPPTIQARLPLLLQAPVAERVRQAVAENVAQRIWRKDPSLWGGPGVPEIEDRLGWLTVSEPMLEHAADLHAFADECRAAGCSDAVLLGMGGSSLGPEVIRRSFGEIPGGLRLRVLDSTHPDVVLGVQDAVDLERHGRDKLTYVISRPIESFGLWAEQLVAESTGKHGRGIVPVVDEPLGDSASVYGDDRVFVYRRDLEHPEERLDAAIEQISAAGHPTITLPAHGAVDLGRHKGGPSEGRFLQIVAPPHRDADVPGTGHSFGTLMAAQAAGDLETLRAHGLPAERVEAKGHAAEAVRGLTQRITAILQES